MQEGLTEVLRASTHQWIYGNSFSITRSYVHEPRGLGAYYLEKSGMVYAGFIPHWMDTLEDGLGSIRTELNHNTQVITGTRTMNPYGDVMAGYSYGAMDSLHGFTGEMVDANNFVYLRARYYDPNIGSFASLDPFEGMVETPLSLNGYTYVEGNPINWVDPSGLCPELSDEVYNMADYLHCHDLVRRLKDWNIKVVWDENSLSPLTCIPQTVRDTAEQLQGIKQRWTANEVRAIYNAFQIFNQAHQTFKHLIIDSPFYDMRLLYDYVWPRLISITVQKQRYVSDADQTSFGIHYYPDTIIFSGERWGEANPRMTMQSRSWLALHEFSHIFAKDRINSVRPDSFLYDVESSLPERIFNELNPEFGMTQYSTRGAPGSAYLFNKEYIIEAITATLWNFGYSAVSGYDSGAGGWTGEIGQSQTIIVNNAEYTLRNVQDIEGLQQFILMEIIIPPR